MATETATQLLNAAQTLVQERGYNAFSYKDLAREIGIRTASIHYHFPTKADLGKALMERYFVELEQFLETIDRKEQTGKAKLQRFIKLYRDAEACGSICLCGSLASDRETLPESIQDAVSSYLERSEKWVAETVAEGVKSGEFDFSGDPKAAAVQLVSSLQGGLILSRAIGDRPLLDSIESMFLQALRPA